MLISVAFDYTRDYVYQDELLLPSRPAQSSGQASVEVASATALSDQSASSDGRLQPQPTVEEQYVLVQFERPVICPHRCLVIGSRLDTDIHIHTNSVSGHVYTLVQFCLCVSSCVSVFTVAGLFSFSSIISVLALTLNLHMQTRVDWHFTGGFWKRLWRR